jgi:isoleucyl-tRNA synthetase
MREPRFPELPGGYPFPLLERETLEQWRNDHVFEQTLAKPSPKGSFIFFEGPPTANNTPHVGHVVTRVVKDLIPRYRTMCGYHVPRKAGWDTHGLAVEIEVEKRLGFSGKKQIEEYGIAEFNRACLDSVHTYERQWRAMTERIGYWLDLDHAYLTYANTYIESVWWALSTLEKRGLLTESYKIQPYCARCGTSLSSHEVAQNYKDTDDPSIWTLFTARPDQRRRALDGSEVDLGTDTRLVAWTTTPWTTLANVALAVHPDLTYRLVERPDGAGKLLFGDGLGTPVPLQVERDGKRHLLDLREEPALARFRGSDLAGLLYDRPFTFLEPDVAGRVVTAEYVTSTEGTGLVHTAPPFGEDDYQTGVRYDLPLLMTVEPDGTIVAGATPFAGLWFKEADGPIQQDLKRRGLLLHSDRYRHSYPFCWRCDRPLLYFATKSWFIKTTAVKDALISHNREIRWHPEHVGEGRFGNWLENVVDWALSRNRYWGTPLPVWTCSCGARKVIGSYQELFAAAGIAPPADPYDRLQFDPHRPAIDEVLLPCSACGGTMSRVPYVIDAWFDSGAMPFAQHHYPFENRDLIDDRRQFPADFIAEAVDQTRGWFYTLHALGTLLFDSVAFRNCIVLGHINDDQGRKMSKRLGNVVEPMAVIEDVGADALRWYFCISNPEVTSRFSAKLVREAAQRFLLPLWNALSFFTIYANLDGWHPGRAPVVPFVERPALDRWVLLRLDRLVRETSARLDSYDISGAAGLTEDFVDELTNWYIRRSRSRFWAADGATDPVARADKESAHQTLYEVLSNLSLLLAPFTPFVAEVLHRQLVRSQDPTAETSVHLCSWPSPVPGRSDDALESGMAAVQRIVSLGHAARNLHGLKTRQPLAAVTLISADTALPQAVAPHLEILREELNVREIRWAGDRSQYVFHQVRPVFPKLGPRLGKRMPELKRALETADSEELARQLEATGTVTIELADGPFHLTAEEVEVRLVEREGMATQGDRELLVALDTQLTPELVTEGRAREIVHHIQTYRKEDALDYADRIRVFYRGAEELEAALIAHRTWIEGETLAVAVEPYAAAEHSTDGARVRSVLIDTLPLELWVDRV